MCVIAPIGIQSEGPKTQTFVLFKRLDRNDSIPDSCANLIILSVKLNSDGSPCLPPLGCFQNSGH